MVNCASCALNFTSVGSKSSGVQLSPGRLRQHDCGRGWDPAGSDFNNPVFVWQLYHLSAAVCRYSGAVLTEAGSTLADSAAWLAATSSSPQAAVALIAGKWCPCAPIAPPEGNPSCTTAPSAELLILWHRRSNKKKSLVKCRTAPYLLWFCLNNNFNGGFHVSDFF